MEEKDLQQLYDELALHLPGQAYQEFTESVSLANEKMKELSKKDTFTNAPPLMKEQDQKDLMGLLANIGRAAEPIIKEGPDGDLKKLVTRITSLAAGEHRALAAYDPAKPQALHEILEDARTLKIDTRGVQMKEKVSGNIHSRQPVTFVDDRGNEVTGVFSRKEDANLWNNVQADLDKVAAKIKNPQASSMVSGLLNKVKNGSERLRLPKRKEEDKNLAINDFMNCIIIRGQNDQHRLDMNKLKDSLSKLYTKELKGQDIKLSAKELLSICDVFADHGSDIGQSAGLAQIQDGTRIDTRNAAYSSVADLLGVPGVVARSRPMKITTAEGEIEGTFMAAAEGEDPKNLTAEAEFMDDISLEAYNDHEAEQLGKAIKNISDLQMLDFICGNVDRHDRNMFYKIDPHTHKLTGVMGIDNDCSFGTLVPDSGASVKEMTGLDNMMVVSRSTHDKVLALTPEELKFSLRGFNLSEKEIDAAGQRLTQLQEKYREAEPIDKFNQPGKGNLVIVEDKDFKKLNFKSLSKPLRSGRLENLYSAVRTGFNYYRDDYKEQIAQDPEPKTLRSDPAGASNWAKASSRPSVTEKAQNAHNGLTARQDRNRPSPSYNDLMKAAEDYKKAQEDLTRRLEYSRRSLRNEQLAAQYRADLASGKDPDPLPDGIPEDYVADPDAIYDSVITSGDLLELKQLGKKLNDAADAYLKAGDDKGKNSKLRKTAAKNAKAVGQQAMNITDEELELAEQNERRALEATNRRVGDALIKAGWEEGQANPLETDQNVEHIGAPGEDDGAIKQDDGLIITT